MTLDPRMAEFVANWQRANVDAMRIDGFSDDDPPPPYPTEFGEVGPVLQEPLSEDPSDEPIAPPPELPKPVSPLVALGKAAHPKPPPPPTPPPVASASVVLQVFDGSASYRGQAVELNPNEQAAIASIVLKAQANRVQAQLKAVAAQLPKRTRVRRIEPEVQEPPKRKRGRPRKIKEGETSA